MCATHFFASEKFDVKTVWNKDDDDVALIVLLMVSFAHVDSGGNPAPVNMATGTLWVVGTITCNRDQQTGTPSK